MKKLAVKDIGLTPYREALSLQVKLMQERKSNHIPDTLILVEHPDVVTIGRNRKQNSLLVPKEVFKAKNIDIIETDRGGDVTFHGPGQIVGYIICSLKEYEGDIRSFMFNLEEVFIQILKHKYAVDSARSEVNTGVWIGNNKITAMGIAVKNGITMHGFAFNVNTDLSYQDIIIPCGLKGYGVTSLQNETGNNQNIGTAKTHVTNYFKKIFNYK
jgi:lipoyl(octanoyl) transferase